MYDFDLFMFHYDFFLNIVWMVGIYILHKITEIIFIFYFLIFPSP